MHVDVTWTTMARTTAGGDVSYGYIGANFTAFKMEEVLKGACWRLTRYLPRPEYAPHGWERETFHHGQGGAQEAAVEAAAAFYLGVAEVVAAHPAIQNMDKVTQFTFPAQLCPGDCPFYGGKGVHKDVSVEKGPGENRWVISRPDGTLFTNPSQEWAEPTEVLSHPGSARFLWPLETALQEVHFMQCG